MRNVALLYASRKGQTEKIVRFMQKSLEDTGCVVEIHDLKRENPVLGSQIDGVVIGGPVYAGHFHRVIRKWMRSNQSALRDKRTGLFVVALNSADKHAEARHADDELLRHFIDWTGVVPDQLANFAGALNYSQYSPIVRAQMVKIAKEAGGDTDVSRDYEYTDWDQVRRYCADFVARRVDSPFSTALRFPRDHAFDSQMRFFEQTSQSKIVVEAPAAAAFSAFSKADSREMKGASVLGRIRTLGTAEAPKDPGFAAASREFGIIPLGEIPGREILGGLVGRFWRFDFGVRKMEPRDFASFELPGFTKVITRFEFVDKESGRSEIRATMRIHSTDRVAARRFGFYWFLLSIGISLYMRSILRGLKREAERTSSPRKLVTQS